MGRLVGRRARGALGVQGAGACVAFCQLVVVVVVAAAAVKSTILASSWRALDRFCVLHIRFLEWKIHRMRRGWWNGRVSST